LNVQDAASVRLLPAGRRRSGLHGRKLL